MNSVLNGMFFVSNGMPGIAKCLTFADGKINKPMHSFITFITDYAVEILIGVALLSSVCWLFVLIWRSSRAELRERRERQRRYLEYLESQLQDDYEEVKE